MKAKKYKELLDMYVANNSHRELFNKPFILKDKVVATNTYELVLVPKEKCSNLNFEHLKEKEHYLDVIPKKTMEKVLDVVKLSELLEQYRTDDDCDIIEDDKECEECFGTGEVDWEYKSWSREDDCPICNGSGILEFEKRIKNGKKTFPDNLLLKLEDYYYDPKYIEKVVNSAKLLNFDEIIISHQSDKGILFELGDVKVMAIQTEVFKHSNITTTNISETIKN
jgi:hypothetical protein